MLEQGRMRTRPPRHVARGTEAVDMADPFQRQRRIQPVLLNGTAQDIRTLDLGAVEPLLDELGLPPHIYSLLQTALQPGDDALTWVHTISPTSISSTRIRAAMITTLTVPCPCSRMASSGRAGL